MSPKPRVVTAAVGLFTLGTLAALHGIGAFEALASSRGGAPAALLGRTLPFVYLVAFAIGAERRVPVAWSFALGAAVLLAAAYPVTWTMFASTAGAQGRDWAPPTGQLVTGLVASCCHAGAVFALLRPQARAWFGIRGI